MMTDRRKIKGSKRKASSHQFSWATLDRQAKRGKRAAVSREEPVLDDDEDHLDAVDDAG